MKNSPQNLQKNLHSSAETYSKISALSDTDLLEICHKFGQETLNARKRFLGTLPEVERRQLWRTEGFFSIFHFAAVLAGVSEEQVRTVINVDKKFINMPVLREQLVGGKISVNKLVRVASVATPENQDFWAEQVQNLSNRAIETLVRDEKVFQSELHVQNTLQEEFKSIKFKTETAKRLEKLAEKGLDLDALINELLDARDQKIAQEKAALSNVKAHSRYIPVRIKRIITAEHGSKCSVPTCASPSKTLHHTARYSITHSHDPHFLAPLCREHHEIAHHIDRNIDKIKKRATIS
ncbi:HNH endonuclease [Candidatus Peregrinibacteria bacterium]|nr:HNH endonuclease [Candidatus Peregrinibacteria bacterium]